MVVTCRGTVETEDKAGVIGRHAGHLPLWAFLGQTALTRPGPRIRQLIAAVGAQRRGHGADAAQPFGRDPRAGGLRDRAHRMSTPPPRKRSPPGTGCARTTRRSSSPPRARSEIPARYVSGYLMMNDRIEQEATHAWAEAWVQGLGWVGFDVSNGISPDPRYVRVATGRDYRDAAPITGISFGSVAEQPDGGPCRGAADREQ